MPTELHVIPAPSEAQVAATAGLLAWAESRRDGWVPVEDLSEFDLATPRVDTSRLRAWTERIVELLVAMPGVRVVCSGDPVYPENLGAVRGRPAVLFIDGSLRRADTQAVAIVGSRQASATAVAAASSLAGELSGLGLTVVSGLARGIDSAAHHGALLAGGRTIAVVGTGIDKVFPAENAALAARIANAGAVVSQFPPGWGPTKTTFPARNAVIAGMALGSLVIDASERSGTRIEIDRTLEQGKPVMLWAPFLASQEWAQELAARPDVHFVASAPEVLERLGS